MNSENPQDWDWTRLPRVLKEIAEVVGLPAADALSRRWGGQKLYIPKNPKKDGELMQLLGTPAASALGHHFGGEVLTIPFGSEAWRALRHQEIQRRYKRESAAEIARDFGMHERSIHRIVRSGRLSSEEGTIEPSNDE